MNPKIKFSAMELLGPSISSSKLWDLIKAFPVASLNKEFGIYNSKTLL